MRNGSIGGFRWMGLAGFGVLCAAVAGDPPADGSDPRWRDRLKETVEKRKILEEAQKVEADLYYKEGLELMKEGGSLDQARAKFEAAAKLGHKEAAAELRKIDVMLGTPQGQAPLKGIVGRRQAYVDQLQFEINKGLESAGVLSKAGRFDEAVSVLERVRDQVRNLPVEAADRDAKTARVEAALQSSRASSEAARKNEEKRKQEEAKGMIIDAEKARLRNQQQRIEKVLADAEEAFDRDQFDYAIRLADHVLKEEPANVEALDIKRRARAGLVVKSKETIGRENKYRNQRWVQLMEELRLPPNIDVSVEFPENWLSVRAYRDSQGDGLLVPEEPWKNRMRERLRKSIGPFDYSHSTVDQIVEKLTEDSQIEIRIDPKVQTDLKQITITKFRDAAGNRTLEQVLNEFCEILDESGSYRWTLKNGEVWISTKKGVTGELVSRFVDVKDLLVKPSNFTAPPTGFATAAPQSLLGEEEKQEEGLSLDDIKKNIETHVPEIVESGGAVETIENTQTISIRAPAETYVKISEVLAGLRNQQNMLVDIHARFLRVESDLADEMGITWQGLGGRLTSGTTRSSGILNPVGKTNDIRFMSNREVNGPEGPLDSAYLGGKAFRLGDPTSKTDAATDASSLLQYSYLSDWQASMVLKAVHMSRKGSIVHAPHLKCFNTQRAYMVLITEKSYIKDVATLVSSGSGAGSGLDPEVGTIREGTSFEVRPVVSADRKFITLEMKPTQAEIIDIRKINVQSAIQLNSNAPPINIEAPILELRQIRTTVSIPDNATILLGGLTAYSQTQAYNGLPGISKIPVLNFLFGKDTETRERNSLMIMVRAMIVDNLEEEEKAFGKQK